jgi:hypothetical protein
VRSKLKKWLWQLFVWQVEVKVKRLDGADLVMYLANLLMDELEAQGCDTMNGNGTMASFTVYYHTQHSTVYPEYPNMHVGHGGTYHASGWRTGTKPEGVATR